MLCGNCMSYIPEGSAFCPECGKKILVADGNTYSSDTMPLAILWQSIYLDDTPFIRLSLYNKSDKTITACKLIVHCSDSFDDYIGDEIIKLIDLDIDTNVKFGSEQSHRISFSDARVFSVQIEQVVFSNGDKWINDGSLMLYNSLKIEDNRQINTNIEGHNNLEEKDNSDNNIIESSPIIDNSIFENKFNELTRHGAEYFDNCHAIEENYSGDEARQLILQFTEKYLLFVNDIIEDFNEFIIPDYIEEINNNVFLGRSYDCAEKEYSEEARNAIRNIKDTVIVLPEGLKIVGENALSRLLLKKIPLSLVRVETSAFEYSRVIVGEDLNFTNLVYVGYAAFVGLSYMDGFIPSVRIDSKEIDILNSAFGLDKINEFEFSSSVESMALKTMINPLSSKINRVILSGGNSENYLSDSNGNIYYNFKGQFLPFWYSDCINQKKLAVYYDYYDTLLNNNGYNTTLLNYMRNYYSDAVDFKACEQSVYEVVNLIKWKCASDKKVFNRKYIDFSVLKDSFPNLKVVKIMSDSEYGYFSYSSMAESDFKNAKENGIVVVDESLSDESLLMILDKITEERAILTQKIDSKEFAPMQLFVEAKGLKKQIDDSSANSTYISPSDMNLYYRYLASYDAFINHIKNLDLNESLQIISEISSIEIKESIKEVENDKTDINYEYRRRKLFSKFIKTITFDEISPYFERIIQTLG